MKVFYLASLSDGMNILSAKDRQAGLPFRMDDQVKAEGYTTCYESPEAARKADELLPAADRSPILVVIDINDHRILPELENGKRSNTPMPLVRKLDQGRIQLSATSLKRLTTDQPSNFSIIVMPGTGNKASAEPKPMSAPECAAGAGCQSIGKNASGCTTGDQLGSTPTSAPECAAGAGRFPSTR